MTHEPECIDGEHGQIAIGPCIFCAIARKAYQRGREDAAAEILGGVFQVIAAARGYDEPTHEEIIAEAKAARKEVAKGYTRKK